jgi:ribosome-interacting GTPase 1
MAPVEEQIEAIEKEIRETPYHKGTEHHIGKLRARLSRLKDRLIESELRKGGGGGVGYSVKKQGDATLVLVGPPSVGKSTLINKLTNAKSKVAPYAFTTVSVIPGMLIYKEAKIQILDVPGLIRGAEEGKGRGREVLSVARGVDLLAVITDVNDLEAFDRISNILYKNGVRINQKRPNVLIDKKLGGGIIIHSNIRQDLDKETVKEIAREMGIKNAEITINEKISTDRLIDAFSPNRVYVPAIYIVNKSDLTSKINDKNADYLYISAEKNHNLNLLLEKIWESLNFITVFLVNPNEEPNHKNPIIMKKNSTLKEVSKEIGSDFAEKIKSAKIWGPGSKFPAQEVSLSTPVVEGMQIQFI